MCPVGSSIVLSGEDVAQIALATQLATLRFDSVIGPGAVEALAAMPHLTELRAAALEPGANCSRIPCACRRLYLSKCPSPRQLLWLPLLQVEEIELPGINRQAWTFRSSSDNPVGDDPMTEDEVRAAAVLLLTRMRYYEYPAAAWAPRLQVSCVGDGFSRCPLPRVKPLLRINPEGFEL